MRRKLHVFAIEANDICHHGRCLSFFVLLCQVLNEVLLDDGVDDFHGCLLIRGRSHGIVMTVGFGVTLGLLSRHIVADGGEERGQVLKCVDRGHRQLGLAFDQGRGIHIFHLRK